MSIKVNDTMENKQLIFTGKNVIFYSSIDEAFFYKWVKNISCIDRVENVSGDFIFYLKNHTINSQDLDRLVGLFARYAIDTKQLKIFLTDQNKPWLKYWI